MRLCHCRGGFLGGVTGFDIPLSVTVLVAVARMFQVCLGLRFDNFIPNANVATLL